MGIIASGMAAMVCIAAGMASTTSLFAILTIIFQNRLFRPAKARQRLFKCVYAVFSLGGAACIAVLGVVLLLGRF